LNIWPQGQRDALGEYCTCEGSKSSRDRGLLKAEPRPALERGQYEKQMDHRRGCCAASVLVGGAACAARSYNPIKWIKKSPGPTAREQLAANKEEEKKLSLQLQALLPPRTSLKDACAGFKDLNDCVAALHVSHNLTIKFNCLKWDVTGAKRPATSNRARLRREKRP